MSERTIIFCTEIKINKKFGSKNYCHRRPKSKQIGYCK